MAVSILVVRGLLEAVEQSGVAREHFLAVSGFDPERLECPDGRITLAEYDALHELALDLTGDEGFGLRLGELASVTTYNLVAHLVAHAGTLRQGIDALIRFHRLVMDRPAWQLVEREAIATLVYEVAPGSLRCRRFRAEVAMTGFYRMVRYFGRAARPNRVAFEHAAPAHAPEYDRVFEGTARFEQAVTEIAFDRELLHAATFNQDAEFHAALEAQAEKRVLRLARNATYADRVRDLLLERSASQPSAAQRADMNAVARALGLSARSLRRRLYEEGVSFVAIAEGALATLAKQLLSDEERSIQETAYALGFSDPSAFYRAFKRWTGTTPRSFRGSR